jgi:glycosyltransferase involved in cell wall biosynthesis
VTVQASSGGDRVILTNIEEISVIARARGDRVIMASSSRLGFCRQCFGADLVIIDNDHSRVYIAALLRPWFPFRLISIDLILRQPRGVSERALAKLKALTLAQVDKFIFYFKNTAGYESCYGIRPERIVYVPFKPNGRDELFWPNTVAEGDYVLCAGRTMRDLSTFVKAMAKTGCPAVLLQQPADIMREHGTEDWREALPPNVKLVIHEDGKLATFLSFIAKAKLVVIPRYKRDIGCTGISTYLMAMALGKCVVISEGPGVNDLLKDEAAIVPAEDADALAATVSRLWNDDIERRQIASCGKQYADSLGGTERLCGDILAQSLLCLESGQAFQPTEKAKPGCVDIG